MLRSALSFTAAAAAAAAATEAATVRTTRSAAKMSAGDVVCTGWLIKSPPEKKLKRFAWRKRWFVLRRGRMCGNPDVLEYYQSKNSKKPICTIDLKECEVEMLNGQLRIKRDFHGKHLFVVKTSSRVFYLVAKTEEEMNSWISSISQICQFGSLEDPESSEEGFPHTPTSLQPSPDSSDRASVSSQPDSSHPLDYLFLSQCETGSVSRNDSFSNSELSLEQRSSEDAVRDIVPSPLCTDSCSSSIFTASPSPSLFLHGRLSNPPFSAPCTSMALPSSSSSPLRHCAASVFQFDQPYSSASFEASDGQTPPPLPPKSNHLSEQPSDEAAHRPRPTSARHFTNHGALFLRRTSLSGLDHFRIGDADSRLMRNRRQSLNLQPCLNATRVQSYQEESYVPMASPSPSPSVKPAESDGYIPMSPRTFSFLKTSCSFESPAALSALMCQPGDVTPPPIHRHLKPRLRRARPPPLDLRGLSTITECPTHLPLSRSMTESCFLLNGLPHEIRLENGDNSRDEETNCTAMHFSIASEGALPPWARRSNLDYLSLDFNSASPSPVQKKPFLSDEHKVDYVQVDEKKTQALQNTKMEWTDVRQSKT